MPLPQRRTNGRPMRGPSYRKNLAASQSVVRSIQHPRPPGRARAGNFRAGNFRPNVKLDTSHIHDMRVSSGTTAQLQGRRAAAKRKFTAR